MSFFAVEIHFSDRLLESAIGQTERDHKSLPNRWANNVLASFFAQRHKGFMFIGRSYEIGLIEQCLHDRSKAQLLILYGRRRIGKSTLIGESLKGQKNVLFFEGVEGAPTRNQIDQFLDDLARQTGRVKLAARNWREVFQGIGEIIQKGRWILVFDEFPWMAAGRSQIVSDLKLYWDRWARNKDSVLFLCGSVASFMTRHLIHSKALHNRKTLEMCLGPLTPRESGRFMAQRGLWEKAQLYMCLGGVPKYLEQIDPKISLEKNLNRHCFCSSGFFIHEFETLFKEQFRAVKTYETIVRHLAVSPLGLSDLARRSNLFKGGGLHQHLENLIRAGFVRSYSPFAPTGKQRLRTRIYKLVDPFLLFYFRHMRPNLKTIESNKSENLFRTITRDSMDQYYGFAFERLCEDSFETIRKRLGLELADIMTMGPYFQRPVGKRKGLQIDNLIMRRDKVWTIMEYKYHTTPVGMSVVEEVSRKIERLPVPVNTSVEKVLIAAAGVTKEVKQSNFFNALLTLGDLIV